MSDTHCKGHHEHHHDHHPHHERNCVVATQRFDGGHQGPCDGSLNVLYRSLIHRNADATVSLDNFGDCPVTYTLNLGDGRTYTETVPVNTNVARTVRDLKQIAGRSAISPDNTCYMEAQGDLSFCLHNDSCKTHQCAVANQNFSAQHSNPIACDGVEVILYQALIDPYPAATFTLYNTSSCPVTFTVTYDNGAVITKVLAPGNWESYTVKRLRQITGMSANTGTGFSFFEAYGTVSYCLK